jgi:hypothetical protein
MAIPKDQAEQIKKQLLVQVEQLQPENKDQLKKYIESMNEQELEDFLKKQNQNPEVKTPECVFCSIINNEIPSYKLAETKKAIAILEINPMSKGHSIVLPKEHTTIEKVPKSSLTLAQKITKKNKKET